MRPYVSDFFLRAAEPPRYLFAIAIPVKEEDGNIWVSWLFTRKRIISRAW